VRPARPATGQRGPARMAHHQPRPHTGHRGHAHPGHHHGRHSRTLDHHHYPHGWRHGDRHGWTRLVPGPGAVGPASPGPAPAYTSPPARPHFVYYRSSPQVPWGMQRFTSYQEAQTAAAAMMSEGYEVLVR
jgi:hypothetical protein